MILPRLTTALLLLLIAACQDGATHDDFCHADAMVLATGIQGFENRTGSIPTTSQGLAGLMKRPADLDPKVRWEQMITKMPMDPWRNPFRYLADCDAHPQKFSIITNGPDGVPSSDDRVFSYTIEHGGDARPSDDP